MPSSWILDLAGFALAAAALFGAVYAVLLLRILRTMRWPRPQVRRLAPAEAPLYLRERAAAENDRLAQLGFTDEGPLQLGDDPGGHPDIRWFWSHAEAGTLVTLSVITTPKRLNGAEWILATALQDGTWMLTTDETTDFPLPQPEGVQEEVALDLSFTPLWELHLQRVQKAYDAQGTLPRDLSAAEAEAAWAAHLARRWESWQADRARFETTPEGSLRAPWGWLLRRGLWDAIRTQRNLDKHATAQKKVDADRPPDLSPEAQVEADIAFAQQQERQRLARRLSPRGRLAVSLVSLLLFLGVMAWRDNVTFALLLSAALLIHELGHIVAMRLCGSRDTSMLFIPLFGGAALRHDRPLLKPWHEVMIVLAGPVPGIVLGFVLLGFALNLPTALPAWSIDAAVILLALNIFNLLPIMPLDGGQIVNLAILNRFPYVGALFKGLSGVALLILGQLLDAKLLWMAAFAFIFRVPLEWRLAGALRDLRRQALAENFQSTEEEPWLRRIFRRFQQVKFDAAANQRANEAIRLAQLLRQPQPGFGTIALALAGWTSPLWLPIVCIPLFLLQSRQGEDVARRDFLALPLPAAWVSPAQDRAAAQARPENAEVDYAAASQLVGPQTARVKRPLPAEAWRLMLSGAQKPIWVPNSTNSVQEAIASAHLGPNPSEITAQRIAETLAGEDRAALLEAWQVAVRQAQQLAHRPGLVGETLLYHLDCCLQALQSGLASRQQRQAPLPAAIAADVAQLLPQVELLTPQVAPAFVLRVRATAGRPPQEVKPDDLFARLYLWSLRTRANLPSETDRLAAAQAVLVAAGRPDFDPWKVRIALPDLVGAKRPRRNDWEMHRLRWAVIATQLDMARGALAWHALSAAGQPPKTTAELRTAWFEKPAPHPVTGRTWEIVARHEKFVGLDIPTKRPPAAAPATDGQSLQEMMEDVFSPHWRLIGDRESDPDEETAEPAK